jgi:hypothetical protein
MRRALAIASASAAVLLSARGAGAYCRSSACPPHDPNGTTQGQICNPPQDGDCGVELQWRQPCVSFNVQQDGSKSQHIDAQTVDAILTQAFNAWMSQDCGGGPPSIQVFDFGPVVCDQVEYNQHGGNANILVFRDDMWPHDTSPGGTDTLALTTVTYDVDKGDIYDADIEVNTAGFMFSTDPTDAGSMADLLSVLTHETGHFLGLAHSQDPNATMYAVYTEGTTGIRMPAPDDVAAICEAYPIDRTPVGDCTGLPRHGWAPECYPDQTYVHCSSVHAIGWGPIRVGYGPLLLLAALALALRARRGSRGS